MEPYLASIPPGREGYIYLLHAEGCPRYKIGRSINPIARCQEIQKQSPYPIAIIKSFWTLDTCIDEAELHKKFKDYRVFGEWFEFTDTPIYPGGSTLDAVEEIFEQSPLISNICKTSVGILYKSLFSQMDDDEYSSEHASLLANEIYALYYSLRDRASILQAEAFIRHHLPNLVADAQMERTWSHMDWIEKEIQLTSFIRGALRAFAFVYLKRKAGCIGTIGREGWKVI